MERPPTVLERDSHSRTSWSPHLGYRRKVEAGLLEALRPRITHRNKPHPSIVAFIGTVSFPNHNPAHLVLVSSSIELSIVAEEHLCGL